MRSFILAASHDPSKRLGNCWPRKEPVQSVFPDWGGMMFSHWAYILIGQNDTGKTTFQRHIAFHLCGVRYSRLPSNVVNTITHPRCPKGLKTLFTSNRSFQEKKSIYKSVENYFTHFFT